MKKKYINLRIGKLASVMMAVLTFTFAAHAQQGTWGNTAIAGGGQATLFGDHTFVPGSAGTQPGMIKTERSPIGVLAYGPSATYTGADDANHVDGYVRKYGTAAFTFPVGSATKLRAVSISAPASGDFKAAYWLGSPASAMLPAGAPFPVAATNLGTGVTGVSTTEYWDVDGPSAVNLTLTWDAASNLNTMTSSNISNLVVVGYNPTSSKWENLGKAGGTTGTLAATGTITANGVTPDTYTAFTFGVAGPAGTGMPDLRPLYVMSDVNFTKPSSLTKNATLRIFNVGETTSIASGLITVYIYPPSDQFSVALGTSPGWSLAYDATDNYYTLTSTTTTVSYGAANFTPVNLVITASPTTSKGKYAIDFEIAEMSGEEVNNLNNAVPIEVTVSGN
jgi:hypothetical protein